MIANFKTLICSLDVGISKSGLTEIFYKKSVEFGLAPKTVLDV